MSEFELLAWMFGIHLVGFIAVGILMLPTLRDDGDPPTDQDSGSDDGWGNLPNSRPDPRGWPGGGLPLPDAEQSSVRLREPGRLADKVPNRDRRPVRDPRRTPVPSPGHGPSHH
ncbi:hypothetical protein [Conexibacter sp. DBS9H8]|uniref:hypothetical protein n=1 Tax=Conexibacter sp. DBS9H8 TaxID=2937801 RepID=UPI00200F7E9A|nr:hypothetical protein [Conexibacter sp. DBS9H8]